MRNLQDILALSTADACIVSRYSDISENIRWANTSTTTNGTSRDDDIVVVSVIGKSVGVATASLTEDLDIKTLVTQSEAQARENPESEDYAELISDDVHTIARDLPETDIHTIIEPLERAFTYARSHELDAFGYAELKTTEIETITSTGLRKEFRGRTGQIELNIKNSERTVSLWEGQSITCWEDQKIDQMLDTLRTKLDWSRNKIDLEPGKYTVVMEPSAATDLLLYAYWEAAARDADEGRTVYSTLAQDKPEFNKQVSLYSNPHEPGFEYADFVVTAASSSYESVFDNGAAIDKFHWIKNGTLKHLFTPRYYATETKRQPAFFGENLLWDSEGKTAHELIKDVNEGLLITCLWYIREVDPRTLLLTGLTRDGVFVIKDGEVVGAANNFRFNMSPIGMLRNIETVGGSQRTLAREFGDYFTRTKIPPLVVKDFNMSTKSDAL